MLRRPIWITAFGLVFIALGLLSIHPARAAICTWTGAVNSDWSESGNWDAACGGSIPTTGDSVFIPDLANDPVIAVDTGVTDITIDSGATLTINVGVTLSVAGNLDNEGGFDANGSVAFIGASDQTVGGSGGYEFNAITVNTTDPDSVVEIAAQTFVVPNGFLTLQQGVFKLSGSFTLSNRVFTTASYTIPAVAGLWLNNPDVTVTAQGGNVTLNGLLRITSGIYGIGTRLNDSLVFSISVSYPTIRPTFIMEGGELNITGRFCGLSQNQVIDFTMSGGVLTVAILGNTSNGFGSFDIPPGPVGGTNSTYIMSGGTIILQNESTASTPLDFRNAPTTWTITGGEVQFGTATTPGTPSFVLGIAAGGAIYRYPSAVFNPGLGGSATVTLLHSMDIYGDLTIHSGVTFNQNGINLTSTGDWSVDGGYTPGAAGLTTFNGAGDQVLSGSGTLAFYNWSINAGATVILQANPPTVANSLTLNGRMVQTQAVSAGGTVNFLQISDGGGNDRFRGVDITNHSASPASLTVEVRGNDTACTSNPADLYRNRCITVKNNEAASLPVDLTLYATPAEDDLAAGDTLYYWDAWLPVPDAVCGVGDGDPCYTTTDTSIDPGDNYFLVAGVIAPTAIALVSLQTYSSGGVWGLVSGLSLAAVGLSLWQNRRRNKPAR